MTSQDKHANGPRLILASASPRRRELLARLGLPFSAAEADINESQILSESLIGGNRVSAYETAEKTAILLAEKKSRAILDHFPDKVVIGSDTVVATEDSILGKPSSTSDSIRMLRGLCGREHRVFTAVSIVSDKMLRIFCSQTSVVFRPRDAYQDALIERYAASGLPLDKAGGYGIQDIGALLIAKIDGDYYTVVGLPLAALARELTAFGFDASQPNFDAGPIFE